MKRIAVIIMGITLASKVIGFIREVALSYFFGASSVTDAYLLSLTIPSVIFGFIGAGIATVYIPMQSRIVKNHGNQTGLDFTNNFMNAILLGITIVLIGSLLFTEYLVRVFALGFSGETFNLAVSFTRIGLFGMYFTTLVAVLSGFLQLKNKFIIPAFVGIPLNVIIIISIYMASKGNINILVIGTLLASASQFLIMLPFLKQANFKYRFELNFKNEYLKTSIKMSLPVIIGSSVNNINVLIDKTIASSLAVGGISALNYSDRLILFIQGLFVMPVVTVMYPIISDYASNSDLIGIKRTVVEVINNIIVFIIPITVGISLFSVDIVRMLFGRGAFGDDAIMMTSSALFFYSFGLIGVGLREVASKCFYSMHDTITPILNAFFGMVINIMLNVLLSKYYGIGGLALASSISAIATAILLLLSLKKKIGTFDLSKVTVLFFKVFVASMLMGIIIKAISICIVFLPSQLLRLTVVFLAGGVSYLLIISMMGIAEAKIIIKLFKRIIRVAE